MIASLGAKVVIEKTCFLANKPELGQGRYSSPILLQGESSINAFENGSDNYVEVEDAWKCPWIGIMGEDGTISCGATDTSASSTCQSSVVSFEAFW